MPKVTKFGAYNLNTNFSSVNTPTITYNKKDNLLYWVKLNSFQNTDSSTYQRSVGYVNLSPLQSIYVDNFDYTQMFDGGTFNGTNSQFFTADSDDLSFGNGYQDFPFSVSLWLKIDDLSSGPGIFTKGNHTLNNVEYYLTALSTGRLQFVLYDESTSNQSTAGSSAGTIIEGQWHHVVITYNGDPDSANPVIIYIDNVDETASFTKGAGYVAMENKAFGLIAGFDANAVSFLDGSISEFAVFNTVLSANDVTAIYERTGYDYVKSGFISLPPRVLTSQFDSATGSYPTIARTGDVTRKGNYSVRFDDTYTVPFKSSFATADIDFGYSLSGGSSSMFPNDFDNIVLTDADGNSATIVFLSTSLIATTDPLPDYPVYYTDKLDRVAIAERFAAQINDNAGLKLKAKVTKVKKASLGLGIGTRYTSVVVTITQSVPGLLGNQSITRSTQTFTERTATVKSARGVDVFTYYHYGLTIPSAFTGGKELSVNRTTNLPSAAERLQRQSYASPNILATNLDGSGSIVAGVSDAHIRFTPGEDLGPFTDSRINLGDSLFYEVGTPESVYPGFSSKLGSKTQLSIDITPSSIGRIYKMGLDLVPTVITDPITQKDQNSGFMYYNFASKIWQRSGNFNTSSLSQDSVYYNLERDPSIGGLTFISGTDRFPMQFTPPMNMAASAGKVIRDIGNAGSSSVYIDQAYVEMGYANIGKPTMSSFAPASSRYYATEDQTLKMSDFITSPFLLEKATIELPVVVRRIQSGSFNNLPGMTIGNKYNYFTGSFYRDMDNYVFFLYRQTRDHDNPSKTKRYLIASGSACFYNSTSFFGSTGSNITPYHNPSFKHDFNTQTPLSSGVGIGPFIGEFSFTGSIKIELTPAIQSKGYLGGNYFACLGGAPLSNKFVQFQHYWPGGTNLDDFQLEGANGLDSNVETNTSLTADTDGFGTSTKRNATIFTYEELGLQANNGIGEGEIESLLSLKNDPRSLASSFGGGYSSTIFETVVGTYSPQSDPLTSPTLETIFARNDISSSRVSPYVLFPGDELVLGVDAGISYSPDDLDGTSGTLFENLRVITGSAMVIESNKESRLTFYGSLIKDNREFHDTLNQPLTSDAVHEAIHYDNPVLDQFEVENSSEYVGTYQDDFFPGKNTNTNPVDRLGLYITSSVSQSAEISDAYAFQRNTTIFNRSLTYFDSYLPSILSLIKNASNVERYSLPDYNKNNIEFPVEYVGIGANPSTDYTASYDAPSEESSFLSSRNRFIFPDDSSFKRTFFKRNVGTDEPRGFTREIFYNGVNGFKSFCESVLSIPYATDNKRFINETEDFSIVAGQISKVTYGLQDVNRLSDNKDSAAHASGSFPKIIGITGQQFRELITGKVQFEDTSLFYERSVGSGDASSISSTFGAADYPTFTGSFDESSFNIPTPKNTPYGMISVSPLSQKYVFRGSRYGQFSDLIYAPAETKFFNSKASNLNTRGREPKRGIQSAAVNVTFVSGSRNDGLTLRNFKRKGATIQVVSEPYFQSSNISTECTSSLPYYDDDVPRNRSYS